MEGETVRSSPALDTAYYNSNLLNKRGLLAQWSGDCYGNNLLIADWIGSILPRNMFMSVTVDLVKGPWLQKS